ncbi:putative mitochondrial protein [Phytophthora megakarya]|uniref:Putative mitochondrial protein n=1 Tax=Phytophthora megakarya TaxID=4795 RepID=A0A225V2Q0_9STRA|nr:putative mitochondrial protein [Phytophthora megakarya]
MDAKGLIERLKARLVACGNEQEFGVNYNITFPAVIDMSNVKLIFALARKWRVLAKHGDVPNAYVNAEKEADLRIYIELPQGMEISEEIRRHMGVNSDDELALELRKALYDLKQAGQGVLLIVGIYVDDLLVAGTQQVAVGSFFIDLAELSVKDLG